MTEDEANRTERLRRLLGLPGTAAPVDPDNPAGPWHIDTSTPAPRPDSPAETLQQLSALPAPLPQRRGPQPVRGFIVPGTTS